MQSVQIVIEAAGDHRFDLNHLRQEGAEELLQQALRKANINGAVWRLQVQKKVTCNAETRPLAVVGCKPWCCYIKIKPGDNNSGHFCTLLMPDGQRGDDVFRALKGVESSIDRNWRFADDRRPRVADGLPASPADHLLALGDQNLEAEACAEADRVELTTWIKDPEKTRLTLLAIHEVSQRGPFAGQPEYAAALAEEMGWQGATGHSIGGVFTSLTRRGFIERLTQGAKHVGYRLSPQGRDVIGDLLPKPDPITPAAPPPVELSFDPTEMLQTLATLAQEYGDAARRLQQNRDRRAVLMAELEKLDSEARDLDRRVNNPEVQSLLRRLVQVTRQQG